MKMKIIIFILLLIILAIYFFVEIKCFKINRVVLTSKKTAEDINIVQITDFHDNKYINNEKLIEEVGKINPDFIFLTGDIIDAKTNDIKPTVSLVGKLVDITNNIYFVWGNHECRNEKGEEFVRSLEDIGVNVLDNENISVEINNDKVNICGVSFYLNRDDYENALQGIDEKNYTILLSHSPNRPLYYSCGMEDLILAGHTHGGQVRLPIIGAVISPGEGFFPKYDKGLFELENKFLYIDSGLGNSVFPIRFLNRVQISNIIIKSS